MTGSNTLSPPRRLARTLTVGLTVLASTVASLACKPSVPPGSGVRQDATAMGSWGQWRDLSPLLEVARTHAPKPAVQAIEDASKHLRARKAKTADKRLSELADSAGRHWIAVARADLAALHFTTCIRGVAWRLRDGPPPSPTERDMDFDADTRIEPGDVSVEALLTNLDAALTSGIPALVAQARIARARVGAFAQRCAANEDVAEMAQSIVESDLATLAAEGHLTPDLAYMWAGVQLNRFSGAAARPFLLQAKEGGFDHPAVTFMLAIIALDERNLDDAERLAKESLSVYAGLGDDGNVAEVWFVRAEVARARKDSRLARTYYNKALSQAGRLHIPALLALATMAYEDQGEAEAIEFLHSQLSKVVFDGPLGPDEARAAASNLESLVIMATEPATAQLSRDALLWQMDREQDPMRRGLRYFYAATLDVRLREYEVAHGHGVLAKEEFAETEVTPPIDVDAFLQRLVGGAGRE